MLPALTGFTPEAWQKELLEGLLSPCVFVTCGHHLGHEGLDSRSMLAQRPANVLLMGSC